VRGSPARSERGAGERRLGLIVASVSLRDFRSYARLDLALEPGLVLAVGPNGAGKTNLLEALHVGSQGFSPRTRAEGQLIRFGAEAARVALRGTRSGAAALELEVTVRASTGKRASLNGAPLRAAEQLRAEVSTLVFTPDRLAVVKGGPAVRRAYLDRALARLLPARAALPTAYAAVLAQRNAALRRVALGHSSRDALAPWTQRVAESGAELVAARLEALVLLQPRFAARGDSLRLSEATLAYEGEPPDAEALEARLERDLERGTTGLGPHLDDVAVRSGTRELRFYGSQGEQRLAVLALLLAEADAIAERRGSPPLLLLDDVLSELDGERRAALAGDLPPGGQAVITATSPEALPLEPAQLVEVSPGRAEPR
jgi:DNA replication and repair protein RecF